ncbi:MAG: NRDE family protein [Nitrococcus sp.]|nr:NRDE family protein [Nitrococcus sp.]
MCLLLVAYRVHADYPIIVAANRDEFHERAAAPAHWWDEPQIFAGRDREAGGTWMGVSRGGRIAAVTNYRDPSITEPGVASRGELPVAALAGRDDDELLEHLQGEGHRYNGFNLLFGSARRLLYLSNHGEPRAGLPAGVYGLSNHGLDTPWPKVVRGKERLLAYLKGHGRPEPEGLFELLRDRHRPGDAALPETGIGLEWERLLAPMFIVTHRYGTRCSTAIIINERNEVLFAERSFDRQGDPIGTVVERIQAA